MKPSISFKEILSRAFQVTRLERTSVLFWCFVFLSSRCLIYKVHAASQRAFILPHPVGLVKHFFQLLSKFSERSARLRLTRTHLSYQTLEPLSRTFSGSSESLVTPELVLSDANSFILADSRAFVKHFFQISEAFASSPLCFSASRKALS